MYLFFYVFTESLGRMLYKLQAKLKRKIYMYDINNQLLRHSKSIFSDYFCKENCDWKRTFEFQRVETPTGKIGRGSVYERKNVSDTKKKTNCKLAK